jgi:K+-dependent Na+/Ca+ exchanger-like protein
MTLLFSALVLAVAVYLLAIITDEYFIVSLDQISKKLKIPSNVAGASLMAMGSSAPELAIALLALFLASGEHSDVGIGTIVGSAIFNILVITGASAIARPAAITWRVVVRDIVMYVSSVALLLFVFADSEIVLWEAALFLLLYAVYIIILFNWHAFAPDGPEDPVETVAEEIDSERERPGLYFRITALVSRVIGFFMGDPEKAYWRTFVVSIIFISIISYFLVEYAVVFAEELHVPPIIVALTVLAAGTSVPDLFASVVVSRQGRGDMAVANAVGSNVFDILIGLGLPWLLVLVFQGGTVEVGTVDLFSSTILLLGTVVLLFVFLTTGHKLSRLEGAVLILVYALYVLWVWLQGG